MKRLDIRDAGLVTEIITDRSVYATAKDDSVTDPYSYVIGVLKDSLNLWLHPEENTLVMFRQMNGIMAEMHIVIKDVGNSRSRSRASCIESCKWLFDNTKTEKIVSMINAEHLHSLALAFECGMNKEGLIVDGMQVDGKKVDLVLIGATKEDFNKLYGGASCHQ